MISYDELKKSQESNKPTVYTAEQLSLYAKQAIDNPIINQALEALRINAFDKIEASPSRDAEDRERLYWFLKALTELKGQLRIYLIDEEKKEVVEDKFNYA